MSTQLAQQTLFSRSFRALFPSLALALCLPLVANAEANGGMTIENPMRPISDYGKKADLGWWHEAKFGLFIHWGVYAVPATGEWNMNQKKTSVADYKKYAARFTAAHYDPEAWARLAKDAGMKYVIITAKHHDGFALFDTQASDWNVVKATPYGKDLLAPLAAACRKYGLRLGFYYSQGQDWVNGGSAIGGKWDPAQEGDMDAYVDRVAIPQVRELLTQYGNDVPAILWWDTPHQFTEKHSRRMLEVVESLRPDVIHNGRLGSFKGHYDTPEQIVPVAGLKGDWETCMTIGDTWGYANWDRKLKSAETLVRKLADIASRGGNFLLNVGPDPEGVIPAGSAERLLAVGEWMKINGESIYGTQAGPFRRLTWGCATRKGDRLYLHVFHWPADGLLRVPLLSGVKSARLLTRPDQSLEIIRDKERVSIQLPAVAPDKIDTVVILELDGEPKVLPLPTDDPALVITASASKRGREPKYAFDGPGHSRWEAPDEVKTASLEIDFGSPREICGYGFDEPDVWPRMKQGFVLEAQKEDGSWSEIAAGKTVGHGETGLFSPVTARRFRLVMTCDKGAPAVGEFQLYRPE